MANNCSNTLTAYGSKKEIQRFVDTFTEDFAFAHLQIRDYKLEDHKDERCRFRYITRWDPCLTELIEILDDFPKLFFKVSFSVFLSNYQGHIVAKGSRVLSLVESEICSPDELK